MQTFEAQVEGLTSLTISSSSSPTQTELSDFLSDGAAEIINAMPQRLKYLCATEDTFTSTAFGSESEVPTSGQILSVTRVSEPCRQIPAELAGRASDSSAFASSHMETATATDPVWYVYNGKVNALPASGACKYLEVNRPSVAYTHSSMATSLASFPLEYEYLVVTYAAIKSLQNAMGNKTSDLPSDITFPVMQVLTIPTLASVGDLTLPVIPTVPTVSAQSVTITGTAPTYVKPTSPSQTSFNSYWTLTDFGDSDPDTLSISAVIPSKPSLTSVTFTSIDSALDADSPVYSTAVVGSASTYTGSAPAFTKPVVSPDFGQVNTYIDTDEDVELAQAKLQEINAQVSEYSTNIQNEQAEFNKENVLYQSAIQESMQEVQISNQVNLAQAQSDLQAATSNKDRDQQRQLQNGVNDMQAIINDNSRKISLYQAEVQTYQADVSKQVQEYTQKLSRYQLELNTVYTAWAKTESDNLAKYQADIQNELNTFNDSNVEYQSKLQKDIQDAQLSDANEARKLQKYSSEVQTYSAEVNSKIQEWVNEEWTQNFQKYQADYSNKLQEYSNDIQSYQAEVSKSVQDFNTKLQKHSTDYQWLQSQYAQLKSDYNSGLQLLLGRPLSAGEQQRR